MAGAQVVCPFQGILAHVRYDQTARALQRDEFLHQVAHKSGADDDHVITQRQVRQLDCVDCTGERLSQSQLKRHIAGRIAIGCFDGDVLGEASAGDPYPDGIAGFKRGDVVANLFDNTADLVPDIYPRYPGHEASGILEKVGDDLPTLKPGDPYPDGTTRSKRAAVNAT